MTDFASIGIQLDSRPVVEGTKALDALADASSRVEQRVRVSNGQMADTSKIMQFQADQAKAAAAANTVLTGSTNQLTLGQQQLIERFREQAATIGMSRSQLMAYQSAQMGLTTETAKAIATVKAHEDAIRAAAKAKEDAARSANQLTDALKLLAAGYALLKIGEYIKDSALLAARYETLGVVMEVVGRNAGYTKTQMITATEAIASQGITMIESRQSAIKLVQAHVDLRNATALARIAQDAAVIGNINSSEAFDRLVNGIARGNVLILRNIGINVNLQSAYAQMADQLEKSTKELTENERVQARLNAVIEHGADINGTYTASMDTAGKQLKSMQRYTEDLKTVIGETFTEVLTVAVMGFTEHLKDSNKEVTELSKNGQLAEWGHNLATVFVGVANAIDNIMTGVRMAGTWVGHQSAGADINAKYDKMQATAPQKATLAGAAEQGAMIERERQAAFAKERADYEAAQVSLGATVDRFQRAFDERAAAQLVKRKEDAAAKLAVDADYMAKLLIVIKENEGKATAIKQAAIEKLYNSVYVGTPTYRDTEGRENTKGQDDRAKRLQDSLVLEQTAFDREKSIYDARDKMLSLYHSKFGMSDDDFYAGRTNARAEYVAAEAIAFARESALIQGYKPKNAEEIAAKKAKYDELLRQHLKFVDDMRNAGGEDSVAAAAAVKKQYDDYSKAIATAGDAEIKSLDASIAKQREHNAEIGKNKEQIELAKQAQTEAGTARLQVEDDAIRALLTEIDLQGILVGSDREIYSERLAYLDRIIAKRKEVAELLASGAILEADAKAAAEASRAWKIASEQIGQSLTDQIMRGGKNAADYLRDLFRTLILRPILLPIGNAIGGAMTGMIMPGAAQAAGAGGAATSAVSAASNAYSLFSGGMSIAGGLGTGFMGSVSGGLLGAGAGSGLTSATGLAIGEGIAGVVGPAAAGAISSGMTMVAAAMPWLAAAAVVGAVLKFGFGHGERETTSSTLTGSFGANGFSGAKNDSWKEKGGWFSSDKTGVTSTSVDAAMAKQFGDGYKAMQAASANFAKAIGVNADSIATRTQAMSITLGKDEAANKQAISDFFTGVGNAMATELVPNLADFTKAGEAASATLQRLAGDFQATDQFASMLGKSAAELFGAAGIGSAAAREHLIDASGGTAALGQKAAAYMQNFYIEANKIAPVIKSVDAAMASLGLASIKTKADFKAQIDGMLSSGALATASGADLFASLMNLAPAFAQAADYATALAASTTALAASVSKEQRGLDIQLMTALGNAEGALAATRSDALAAMLSDQARLTQQQIWAAEASSAAIAKAQASAAAQQAAAASAATSFGNSLVGSMNNATAAAKALRAFNDSLLLGNLSPLSKGAQYDIAKQAYLAAPSDQAASTAFLQASQARGGSKFDYASDFAMVSDGLSRAAAAQDQSVINLQNFAKYIAVNGMFGANGSHANGLDYVPFDGYRAILHKGESVKTAAETRNGGGMSESTARELIAVLNRIDSNTEGTEKHSRKQSDILVRVTKDGKSLLTTAA